MSTDAGTLVVGNAMGGVVHFVTATAESGATTIAMAELLLTGCTTTTDHHYLYPAGAGTDTGVVSAAADAASSSL